MTPEQSFTPPFGLRNAHIQNIASSVGLRRWLVNYRTQKFQKASREVILHGANQARLQGFYNKNPKAKSLIVLLHGWEGSSQSAYILSAAERLYREGHSIFRLNFRDHGDTHHLNKELFNSTRLADVTGAMENLQSRFKYPQYYLAGFSLGGNFTLRTTIAQRDHDYVIHRSVAICPVICPNDTMHTLATGPRFYEQYFVKKWKQSLLEKTRHFPHYTYKNKLRRVRTLKQLNEFFIPGYTPFDDSKTYFDAYHLKDDRLAGIHTPTTIITSEDDPIVRHEMLPRATDSAHLSLEVTRYGSHCAFLKNYKMDSWTDDRLAEIFSNP